MIFGLNVFVMEQKSFNNILILAAIFVIMLITLYTKWLKKEDTSKVSEQGTTNKDSSYVEMRVPSKSKDSDDNQRTASSISGEQIASTDTASSTTDRDYKWAVTLNSVSDGRYTYLFLIDGKKINDPNNSNIIASEAGNIYSIFEMNNQKSEFPEIDAEKKNVTFIYYGEIRNNGRLICELNGWEWSIDEFEPVSNKAQELYDSIEEDKSLGKIKGIVLDKDGKPVELASVMIKPLSEKSLGSRTAKTSSDGNFQIDCVYPSNYVIIAKSGELAVSSPQMIKVVSGKITDAKIVVESKEAEEEN